MHAKPLSDTSIDERTTRAYRVAQWATGTIGARALRAIIEHPHMTLAGVYVHGPEKVGRDAGELCGTESTGIPATASIEEILELGPDCVLYMPNALNLDELCRLLTAGINVVTTCGAFHYPASMDTDVRTRVQTACELGGTSVHSTGSSPGFITEAVPLVLTSIQRQLNALTIDEYAGLSQRNSPELLFDLMGFGRPAGPFEQFRADYLRSSFGPSLRLVADAIGLPLDSVEASGELAMASRETLIAAGTLAAGTVAAQRITISGIRAGRPLIRSGRRGTALPTWIPHGMSARQVGTCRSTATHRWKSLFGCPSPWTAWRRCRRLTPLTGRSMRCLMSARRHRAFTRRWTFPRSSRRSGERQVLLSGEYKLPKTSFVLTPARGRCHSCETKWRHVSYEALIRREAAP
jgi:2,4-diaminopentanoate dehydrogenase